MPALLFPLAGFTLGVVLAWVAFDELAGGPMHPLAARGALDALWFGGLVFAPAAAYLLAFYPDWCFSYWLDAARLGTAPLFALVLLDAACPALGFSVAARFATTHRRIPMLRLAGVPTLLLLSALLLHARRLRTFGTYAQFRGDFGLEPIAGSPLGYAVLLVGSVVFFGWLWTARVLKARASRRHGN